MHPSFGSAQKVHRSLLQVFSLESHESDFQKLKSRLALVWKQHVEPIDSRGLLDLTSLQLLTLLNCYVAFDACSIWSQILS